MRKRATGNVGTEVAQPRGVRILQTALVVMVGSGCTTTAVTQRVALATVPGAPQAVAGGSGVGLAARILTAAPSANGEGGAVAFPTYQPELGVLVRVAEHSYASAKLALASGSFAVFNPSRQVNVPSDALAVDFTGGFGHDVKLSSLVGTTLSGEVGLATASLSTVGGTGLSTYPVLLVSGRAAAALYVEPGPVRLFAAASVGTGTWNDFSSVQTTSCSIGCSRTETGQVSLTAVAMAGVGLRWQPSEYASIGIEGWMPLSSVATRLPFTVAASVRFGDFGVSQPNRPRPSPAPAPVPIPEEPLTPPPPPPPLPPL